jgi:hypothetical protein
MQTLEPTLGQLILSAPALRALMQQPLPAAVSFRLDDVLLWIDPELESYDAALARLAGRYDAIQKQGEDGRPQYEFPAKHREIVKREIEQLLETKISIPYEPLQRPDIASVAIKAADIRALAWLFAKSNGGPAVGSSSKKSEQILEPKPNSPARIGRRAGTREKSARGRIPTIDADASIERLEK